MLLRHWCRVNAATDRGETALHTAAAVGHYKVCVETVLYDENTCCADPTTDGKFFIPSMIAGTLAVIGCDSLLFYARISLDKDLSC